MQRRTINEVEMGGHRIPANTILFIPPLFTHNMSEWWTDPQKFDPDRFAEPRLEQKRHAFNYIAFGGGAHKCIGIHFAIMQAKVFMFHFLRRYRFTLANKDDKRLSYAPLPKPTNNLPLVLERI